MIYIYILYHLIITRLSHNLRYSIVGYSGFEHTCGSMKCGFGRQLAQPPFVEAVYHSVADGVRSQFLFHSNLEVCNSLNLIRYGTARTPEPPKHR
jgi:hypothetical protein